jgi:hypothetical protein
MNSAAGSTMEYTREKSKREPLYSHPGIFTGKKGTWREAKFPLSGKVRLRSSHEQIPNDLELRRTAFSDGLPAVTQKSRVYVCDEE